MYWELWLSQVTARAALQCMLVQNKGGQALCVNGEAVHRLDKIELNCLAKEKDVEEVDLNISHQIFFLLSACSGKCLII